jgi:hypothetical protein
MSNPAQPSFVWQLYHYDLEPNASFFAVLHAAEPIHVQHNEATGELQIVNNTLNAIQGVVHVAVYAPDGSRLSTNDVDVDVPADSVAGFGQTLPQTEASGLRFIDLQLVDPAGKSLSRNFYWLGSPDHPNDLTAMDIMPRVNLVASTTTAVQGGETRVTVTLKNPTAQLALMAHLQLRRRKSNDRVLPAFYTDNYISLAPEQSATIVITCSTADLHGDRPLVTLDGWNVGLAPGSSLQENVDADVAHWPFTGLPYAQPEAH